MKQNHELLMVSLGRFYSAPENIKTVVDITEGRSDISLRMIDWFITNYAKRKSIIHKRGSGAAPGAASGSGGSGAFSLLSATSGTIGAASTGAASAGEASTGSAGEASAASTRAAAAGGPENVTFFSVYLSYRDELRTYSKQQFDPFRRNEHIVFRYGSGGEIETTVGQLNFFRWAIENGIIDYISQHKADIENAMLAKGARSCATKAQRSEGSSDRLPIAREERRQKGAEDAAAEDAAAEGVPSGRSRHKTRRVAPAIIAKRSVISFD